MKVESGKQGVEKVLRMLKYLLSAVGNHSNSLKISQCFLKHVVLWEKIYTRISICNLEVCKQASITS